MGGKFYLSFKQMTFNQRPSNVLYVENGTLHGKHSSQM